MNALRQTTTERRWELTEEEQALLEHAHAQPMKAAQMVRLMLDAPGIATQLAPEIARVLRSTARGLARGDAAVSMLIRTLHDRQLIPGVGLGVGYLDYRPTLEAIERFGGKDKQALELGGGGGRVSRLVAPMVGHLTVTDISKAMVNEAREALSHFTNVTCEVTDGFTLREFVDQQFDVVYGVGIAPFMYPNQLLAILAEVARVLRPGGVCVTNYTVLDDPDVAQQHLERSLEDGRAKRARGGVEHAYLLDGVLAFHQIAGLTVLEPAPGERPALHVNNSRVVVVGQR